MFKDGKLENMIKHDLEFIMVVEQKNIDDIAKATTISRNTIYEILESNTKVLFHDSKKGLENVSIDGSRINCDFGQSFYLGENIRRFLHSDLLKILDTNESSSLSLNVKDGMEWLAQ